MKQPILNHWTGESPVFESYLPKVINYKFDLTDNEPCPQTADFGYTEASHQEMCHSLKTVFKIRNYNALVTALTKTVPECTVKTITKDPEARMINFAVTAASLLQDTVKGHGTEFVLIAQGYLLNCLLFDSPGFSFKPIHLTDVRLENRIFVFKDAPIFGLHLSLPIDADGLQGQHTFNIPTPIAEMLQQPITILNIDFGNLTK